MLNIAVCDDNINCINELITLIKTFSFEHDLTINIDTFTVGQKLIDCKSHFDIIFLDIEIEDENGIEVAKSLREKNSDSILIFNSNFIQYAPLGYQVKAFAYLLKNDLQQHFTPTMKEACKEVGYRNSSLSITIDKHVIKLLLNQIIYVESFNKYLELHTIDDQTYHIRKLLKELEKELCLKGFIRIHKSFLVNLEHIKKINNYTITLTNQKVLKVGLTFWKETLQKYVSWKGRM